MHLKYWIKFALSLLLICRSGGCIIERGRLRENFRLWRRSGDQVGGFCIVQTIRRDPNLSCRFCFLAIYSSFLFAVQGKEPLCFNRNNMTQRRGSPWKRKSISPTICWDTSPQLRHPPSHFPLKIKRRTFLKSLDSIRPYSILRAATTSSFLSGSSSCLDAFALYSNLASTSLIPLYPSTQERSGRHLPRTWLDARSWDMLYFFSCLRNSAHQSPVMMPS